MTSYTIRPARRDELGKIQAIERAAGQLFLNTPHDWIPGDEGMSLTSLEHWLVHGKIWVAVDETDEPVGFAVAHEVDGTAYLHELDVDPKHGRQGLGTRLIAEVTAWAQACGYGAVTLSTFVAIPWNAPYYQKLGFRILQEVELGPGLREVRANEIANGFAPDERVCMIRPVSREQTGLQ
ncbi:MAG: GNAT family N-acetyltransferase [Caldilineaceae bacterium]